MAEHQIIGDEQVSAEELMEEFVRDSIDSNPEASVSYNGRTAQMPRQGSMLAIHPEMDEHAAIVQKTVRDLAGKFPEGAEISLGVKVPYELVTKEGELMDARISIKVDVKPKKEEK